MATAASERQSIDSRPATVPSVSSIGLFTSRRDCSRVLFRILKPSSSRPRLPAQSLVQSPSRLSSQQTRPSQSVARIELGLDRPTDRLCVSSCGSSSSSSDRYRTPYATPSVLQPRRALRTSACGLFCRALLFSVPYTSARRPFSSLLCPTSVQQRR